MKLINRYNLYLVPLLMVLFIISSITGFFFIKNVLQNELDEQLLRSRSRIEKYVLQQQQLPNIESFDGMEMYISKTTAGFKDTGISSASQYIPEQKKMHLSRKMVFTILFKSQLYTITILKPLEGTRHLTKLIALITVFTVFMMLLLLLLVNRQLLKRLWKPFYDSLLHIGSFKISQGEHLQFPGTSIEEFNLMNNHFTKVAENARQEYNSLKEFSENASHEIQTPLAVIHSKLDLLVQGDDMTERQSDIINTVYTSVQKLSKIQDSLLLLTKIDNRQFEENSIVQVNKELWIKQQQFHIFWENKNIHHHNMLGACTVNCNKELMEVLLNNLFTNATRHNIKNGKVEIKSGPSYFEIWNTGINEPLDSEKLFKRFYKNTTQATGTGLGLSIIQRICEVSSINVQYRFSQNMHGFCFSW